MPVHRSLALISGGPAAPGTSSSHTRVGTRRQQSSQQPAPPVHAPIAPSLFAAAKYFVGVLLDILCKLSISCLLCTGSCSLKSKILFRSHR